jgi:hypothetical protein
VEQGEPDGPLGVGIAPDRDLGVGPPGRPGGAVLGQQPVEPDLRNRTQLLQGRLGRRGVVRVAKVDGQALHPGPVVAAVLAGGGG